MWWDERSVGYAVEEPSTSSRNDKLTATVDLDCPYVRDLVLQCFQRRPEWRVTLVEGEGEEVSEAASSSTFHWGEYERIDWAKAQEAEQYSSCYCVRKGLIRKAHLAHNTKKWAAKHPGGLLARCVPETHILEVDHPEYLEEALCDVHEVRDMEPGSATWIAKPSITNQALGVCIFDRVEQLQEAVEANEDLREWVLQRYVDNPLLIGGRKFHLRAYVLCVGSLSVHVFSEGLALFAGTPYEAGRKDFGCLTAHLTNTCHLARHLAAEAQRQRDGVADGAEGAEGPVPSSAAAAAPSSAPAEFDESEVVKLVSELPQALAAEGMPLEEAQAKVDKMWDMAHKVIGECLEAVSSELSFFSLPNCFELFGFDLLVDSDWHVWLLEANAEPDLMQTGERLRPLIAGLLEGVCREWVDPLASKLGTQPSPCPQQVGIGRWTKVFETDRRRAW